MFDGKKRLNDGKNYSFKKMSKRMGRTIHMKVLTQLIAHGKSKA